MEGYFGFTIVVIFFLWFQISISKEKEYDRKVERDGTIHKCRLCKKEFLTKNTWVWECLECKGKEQREAEIWYEIYKRKQRDLTQQKTVRVKQYYRRKPKYGRYNEK